MLEERIHKIEYEFGSNKIIHPLTVFFGFAGNEFVKTNLLMLHAKGPLETACNLFDNNFGKKPQLHGTRRAFMEPQWCDSCSVHFCMCSEPIPHYPCSIEVDEPVVHG